MEKLLGVKIQSTSDLGITGLQDRDGIAIVFFEVPEAESSRKTFLKLTNATDPPNAKNGGVAEYGCSIEAPSGFVYHALTIRGDVGGWRKDIELGAAQLGLSLARIIDNKFVVCGDQEFQISNCAVKFF